MARKLYWLIHKDLVLEYRTRQALPAMFLWGVIVAMVFSLQIESVSGQTAAVAAALLWLAILLAGLIAIERTCAAEQQNACWDGLAMYGLPTALIYLSKLSVNLIALLALACLLIPLFVVFGDVPLLNPAWAMTLVAVLGSLGTAALGTLVSGLTFGLRQRTAILSLLVLPLTLPVLLAAGEATRLIIEGSLGPEFWRCVRMLGACAIVYAAAGLALFGYVLEE
jgi:heme exporter protein B